MKASGVPLVAPGDVAFLHRRASSGRRVDAGHVLAWLRLLSSDHFTVDGTMIQAWSSLKSVKPIEPGEGTRRRAAAFRRP